MSLRSCIGARPIAYATVFQCLLIMPPQQTIPVPGVPPVARAEVLPAPSQEWAASYICYAYATPCAALWRDSGGGSIRRDGIAWFFSNPSQTFTEYDVRSAKSPSNICKEDPSRRVPTRRNTDPGSSGPLLALWITDLYFSV